MKKFIQMISVLIFLLASYTPVSHASDLEGKTLYTRVNMHSLKGKVVTWVNYAVDTLIPVNTPVEVTNVDGWGGLKFKLKDSDITLKLKNKSHSGLSNEEWARKHFNEQKVDLNKFSKAERDAIASGEVKIGMSKDAVIVSRGYPPAHKTPSLESSSWLFWNTKWNKVQVNFGSDGKVSSIKD
ncbi:MAG: hypothetical protein P8179_14475 [Candidatus Thiodiazotropha sp.]|jgi:hypothetical protein